MSDEKKSDHEWLRLLARIRRAAQDGAEHIRIDLKRDAVYGLSEVRTDRGE